MINSITGAYLVFIINDDSYSYYMIEALLEWNVTHVIHGTHVTLSIYGNVTVLMRRHDLSLYRTIEAVRLDKCDVII